MLLSVGARADWAPVGSAGFSADAAYYTSLAFAPDGTPYVAYQDRGNSSKATVMRFTGGTWQVVGSAGFSVGATYYTSLAFVPAGTPDAGTPYVAYQDVGNGNKATVMRFDGSAWQVVGSAGFSAGVAYYTSLAFAPAGTPDAGTPYVAYRDVGNGNAATVMRFDGSAWQVVGSAGFSAGPASYTSLAFAPDGTPYVAYQDIGNGNAATVMRFATAPTITTSALADGTVGVAYSVRLAANDPAATWAVTSGALPLGLTIDPATGVISGTPKGPAGTASFEVTATNAVGDSAPVALSITIKAGNSPTAGSTAGVPTLSETALLLLAAFVLLLGGIAVGGVGYGQRKR